jgi:hypothetical protein
MMMMVDSDLLLVLAVSVPCLHLPLCSLFLKDKRVANWGLSLGRSEFYLQTFFF